jgi:hypothetical protein
MSRVSDFRPLLSHSFVQMVRRATKPSGELADFSQVRADFSRFLKVVSLARALALSLSLRQHKHTKRRATLTHQRTSSRGAVREQESDEGVKKSK